MLASSLSQSWLGRSQDWDRGAYLYGLALGCLSFVLVIVDGKKLVGF